MKLTPGPPIAVLGRGDVVRHGVKTVGLRVYSVLSIDPARFLTASCRSSLESANSGAGAAELEFTESIRSIRRCHRQKLSVVIASS